MVRIQLETVDPEGAESDQWYTLSKGKEVGKGPRGRVRLKMRFLTDDESGYITKANHGPFAFTACGFAADDATKPPNELWVRVVQARNLRVMDSRSISGGGGSSDPRAVVRVENQKCTTDVCKKTLEPIWNTTFQFGVLNQDAFLDLIVEDEDPLTYEFMGKITHSHIFTKHTRLFTPKALLSRKKRGWTFACVVRSRVVVSTTTRRALPPSR